MKQETTKRNRGEKIAKAGTNFILGALIFSVGSLCVFSSQPTLTADGGKAELYRCAEEHPSGVSLMFNVYWGTDEVYRILKTLEKYQAKATFFIGGCWADDNVDCLREIFTKGHEIGNHGYFHKAHEKMDFTQNEKEIVACNRFIELALGQAPTLFAPPSGAYNEETLAVCKALGMKTVLWSKDTIDWRDKNAALIYQRATKNVKSGDFVLLHPMAQTADALEDILKYYQRNSLTTVTVSENLEEKG